MATRNEVLLPTIMVCPRAETVSIAGSAEICSTTSAGDLLYDLRRGLASFLDSAGSVSM